MSGSSIEAVESYGQIAEAFAKTFQECQAKRTWSKSILKSNPSEAFLFYTLKMEEAYCRAATGLSDELEIASQRYNDVLELFPDAPIAWLRIGQVSSKLKNYDASVLQFKKSLELVDTDNCIEAFLIKPEQLQYLRENVYRLLGYAHWRIFCEGIEGDRMDGDKAFLDALVSACVVTIKGLEFSRGSSDIRLLNNLIFYYHEVIKLREQQRADLTPRLPGIHEMGELFDRMVGSFDISQEVSLEVLDTIVVVGPTLERRELALTAARRVLDLIHGAKSRRGAAPRPEVVENAGSNAYQLLAPALVGAATL